MVDVTGTLAYNAGETIQAKVQALNSKGWSVESNPNSVGIFAQTIPTTAPTGLTSIATSTTDVLVSWTALSLNTETGYSAITQYTINWNQGNSINIWAFKTTSTTNSISIGTLTKGSTYQFKVFAENIYGVGPETVTATSILVAMPPNKMADVIVTQTTTNVVFTWTAIVAPDDNGDIVNAYELQILNKGTGTFSQDALCNDSVLGTLTCSVAMSHFTGTLGYAIGDTIQAQS